MKKIYPVIVLFLSVFFSNMQYAVAQLTVTINQTSTQSDPTTISSVSFTAVFSQPIDVSTFKTACISLSGTAPGKSVSSITQIAPNDSTTFLISVSATGPGTIIATIPATTSSTVFGTTSVHPRSIAIDDSNNIYTANITTNSVSKITPMGVSTIYGITGTNPESIAIDALGNIYTSNVGSNNVTEIATTGAFSVFGTTGSAPGGIAIDGAGNIYTSNENSNNVTKITPSGVSTILGTTGSQPIDIAIDGSGNIYTANIGSNNVTKITPTGISTTLGTTGSFPTAIAVDGLGNVYTVSQTNNNVTKITPAGVSTILGTTGSTPFDIAVDGAGNIYTANQGSNNVTKITPAGVSTILGTTDTQPIAIAISASGNIYTANYSSNDVSKIGQGISTISGIRNSASTSTDNSVTIVLPLTVTINQSIIQTDPASTLPVSFIVVFSQPIDVSTFTTADIALSGTATGKAVSSVTQLTPNDGTTFLVSVFATGTGTIIANIPAAAASNSLGINNTASTSTDNNVTVRLPLTVAINQSASQADPATSSPVSFTAVFNQPVDISTFTTADIALSGTAAGKNVLSITQVAPNDNTTFVISISASGSGTVVASIPAGSISTALASNTNTASTSTDNSVTIGLPLNVTINQATSQTDPTTSSPVSFTVVFNHPINISTFTTADILLSGTAAGKTVSSITQVAPNDNTTFTISISATASGTVIASIPAGSVATPLAGNTNTASTSTDNSITITLPLTVTINQSIVQADPTASSPVSFTVVFNQPINISTFTTGSLSLAGTAVGKIVSSVTQIAPNNGTTFLVTVSATGSGTIIASIASGVVSTSLAGNTNTASTSTDNSVTIALPLTVTINQSASQADPAISSPVSFTVVFNRPIDISTFTTASILLNGTATGETVLSVAQAAPNDGTTFLVNVSATSSGTIIANIPAGSASTTLAGNTNIVSTSTDNIVTLTLPVPLTVTINQSTSQADPTIISPVSFTVVFNQPIDVSTFTASGILLSGTASGETVSSIAQVSPNDGTTFLISVSATGAGTIVATIPAGNISTILTGNINTASTSTDNDITYVPALSVVSSIDIYPNPVIGGIINLHMNNIASGNYNIRIIDVTGRPLLSEVINHDLNDVTNPIEINRSIAKGTYILQVLQTGKVIAKIVFENQ